MITKVPTKGHTGSLLSTSLDQHFSMLVASRGNLSLTDPIDVFVTIVFQRSVTLLPLSEVRNCVENCRVAITGRRYVMTHAMRSLSHAAGHQLPLTHRALTVPRYRILHVLNRLFL